MSKEYIYNSLMQLLEHNAHEKALICQADPFTHVCTEDYVTLPITVVDDGTSTNETRLGAVKDIQFAVDKLGIDEDVLVLAGDNVLDFSLVPFVRFVQVFSSFLLNST